MVGGGINSSLGRELAEVRTGIDRGGVKTGAWTFNVWDELQSAPIWDKGGLANTSSDRVTEENFNVGCGGSAVREGTGTTGWVSSTLREEFKPKFKLASEIAGGPSEKGCGGLRGRLDKVVLVAPGGVRAESQT